VGFNIVEDPTVQGPRLKLHGDNELETPRFRAEGERCLGGQVVVLRGWDLEAKLGDGLLLESH